MKHIQEGLTFDDVLLIPSSSNILPKDVSLHTRLTKNIDLTIPIISAAMDTVTESRLASALAQEGGIGILHRHMNSADQVQQVVAVKQTPVDESYKKNACIDAHGNLRVGAAIGVDLQSRERVAALADAQIDVVVIDTAHGHSQNVIAMLSWIKQHYPDLPVIAGNIVTGQAARILHEHGVDGVKVGIGPGAACTTRIIAGVGFPQLSAILQVAEALEGTETTIIADGGIRFSGDIGKALAAGAHSVMIGQLFAGSAEAPGSIVTTAQGVYKKYRGMHSLGALSHKNSADDQHFAPLKEKMVPEGAEGCVLYRGTLSEIIFQLMGGLRACMGYLGCATINELIKTGQFVKITSSGIKESHVHDLMLTIEAPNYRVKQNLLG